MATAMAISIIVGLAPPTITFSVFPVAMVNFVVTLAVTAVSLARASRS